MRYNLLITLIKRWGSENPKFWQILQNIGLLAFLALGGVFVLNKFKIISVPPNWLDLLHFVDGIFAGVFATAAAGTTDPKLMDDKTVANVNENTIR